MHPPEWQNWHSPCLDGVSQLNQWDAGGQDDALVMIDDCSPFNEKC